MTALRVAAWGSALLSVVGMVGVALSGFCADSSLAEFAWIIGGLFALVLLIGLAALTYRDRERLLAIGGAVVGAALGTVVGLASGFAGMYPGAC